MSKRGKSRFRPGGIEKRPKPIPKIMILDDGSELILEASDEEIWTWDDPMGDPVPSTSASVMTPTPVSVSVPQQIVQTSQFENSTETQQFRSSDPIIKYIDWPPKRRQRHHRRNQNIRRFEPVVRVPRDPEILRQCKVYDRANKIPSLLSLKFDDNFVNSVMAKPLEKSKIFTVIDEYGNVRIVCFTCKMIDHYHYDCHLRRNCCTDHTCNICTSLMKF